jgi:hypothetical protein
MANYSMGVPLPDVENGHEFTNCNFAQMIPHTAIFEGLVELKFTRCDLVNCDIPQDAVLDGCLHFHRENCTNIRPRLIDQGLTPCAENCDHVVDTDELTIDGVLIHTIYHYQTFREE